jgi:hypothetical protein
MSSGTGIWKAEPPETMTLECQHFFEDIDEVLFFLWFAMALAKRVDTANEIMGELTSILEEGEEEDTEEPVQRSASSPVLDLFAEHSRLIWSLLLTRGVDTFLHYIASLLALIYRTKPESLRSSETVRLDFVLQRRSMEELVEDLADRRVQQLSFQGMEAIADDVETRLGLKLFENQAELRQAVRIIESRNLIVHNRGLISPRFLDRVPDSTQHTGEPIDLARTMADVSFLAEVVSRVDQTAVAKFNLGAPASRHDLRSMGRHSKAWEAMTGRLSQHDPR